MVKIDSVKKLVELINEDLSTSPVFDHNIKGNAIFVDKIAVLTKEGKTFAIHVKEIKKDGTE
jgi:hypothetical protein